MTYNEKRQNNSLERIIWNNYILSQNYSVSKILISNLWISSIGIHTRKSSLNWTTTPHLALIAEAKLRNMTFKNRLKFLTLKLLVCLLESSLESVDSSAITAQNDGRWDLTPQENYQIPRIINQKIVQKLIEKISMTDIARQLAISTSTVIRKLNDFHFKHDFSHLPEIMSWDVETVRGVTVSIGRWRWVLLRKILTISISSLSLKAKHRLSSEITFLNMIELSVVRWKSLQWICLALTMA